MTGHPSVVTCCLLISQASPERKLLCLPRIQKDLLEWFTQSEAGLSLSGRLHTEEPANAVGAQF